MTINKDLEVTVVRSLMYVLDYRDKYPRSDAEEILKKLSRELYLIKTKKDSKITAFAIANEALKLKQICGTLKNKHIIQTFVKRISGFSKASQ